MAVLTTYTVYRRAGGFVAVRFEVEGGGEVTAGPEVAWGSTLQAVRHELHAVAPTADVLFTREVTDAPDIVETWL